MKLRWKTSLIVLVSIGMGTVAAQELPAVRLNIPAQSLADAMDTLAKQTGLHLFYSDGLLKDKRSAGVSGAYTPRQALEKLLAGTGLSYTFTAHDAVAVREEETGPASTLPKVTVKSSATYESEDPFNPDYNRKDASSATKTNTPVMNTPVNIQVLPKAVLNDQQTIQMTKALTNVAGVSTSSGSGGLSDDIFLRGFRTSTYFRNGFRIDSQFGSIGTRQMANVERLEVIKGPASILYGRMEPGGMVNVVTKTPLTTPYYSLQQQFGSWGMFRTTADATGPITGDDSLLYRFSGSFESSGSFRELVDNERTFLAPVLTWNISPRTRATLEMEYRHDNLSYDPMIWPMDDQGHFIRMPRSRNLMERTPSKVDEKLVGLTWSHEFNDDWKISQRFVADLLNLNQGWSSTGAFSLSTDNPISRTLTRVPGEWNTYYTTVDLQGRFDTAGLKHTILVGGDYYRTDFSSSFFSADWNAIDVFRPGHDSRLISPFSAVGANSRSSDYFGLYGQDQIDLPFDLHVMGGLRYQYVTQRDNLARKELITDDDVTPRVGVLWRPRPWVSLYGNYVENFGTSNFGALTVSGKPLPPERAEQFEGGVKFEFFDGRFSATLAYFDLTKQNVATHDPSQPPTTPYSIAAGEVRSRGPEIDVRGEVLPGWNIIATYANWDTRVTKDNNGLKGNRLYAVPRNVGSLWTTYDFRDGVMEGFKAGGGLTARDGSTDGSGNGYQTASYATVDLLAAYSWWIGKSKVTTQLNVYNLLDKTYFTDAFIFGAGSSRTIGTPRSLLGSVRVEF